MTKQYLLKAIQEAASQTLDTLDAKTLRSWLENPGLLVDLIQRNLKQDPLPYTFPVLVNYDRLLEETAVYRENALGSSDFPTDLHGLHVVHVRLIKYGTPLEPQMVRNLLENIGHRPANAYELLSVVEKWADYLTNMRPIVALGQPGLDAILFYGGHAQPFIQKFGPPQTFHDGIYYAAVSVQSGSKKPTEWSGRGVNHPFD